MSDRVRWTDDRLDDFARGVELQFASVRDMPNRMTQLEGRIGRVFDAAEECNGNVKELRADLALRAKEREQEKEQARKEHKSDRRYQLTAAFTASGLVIAALGLFGDKF